MKTQYRCSAITAESKTISLRINTELYPDAHQQFMDYISVVAHKEAVKTLSGVNIEAMEVDDD